MSLVAAFARNADALPDGLAYSEGGADVLWPEAARRIGSIAGALRERGVTPGARVATLSGNSARHFEVLMATWWAGGIVVPVNSRLADAEVRHILHNSGASILVTTSELRPDLTGIEGAAPEVLLMDDGDLYGRLLATEVMANNLASLDETAAIFYTGGTTGVPKGVELTHGNFLFAAMGMQRDGRHTPSTVYQHAAPLFHLADFGIGLGVTLAGGTHVFLESFSPEAFYQQVRQCGVTHINLVPTMLKSVLDAPERDDEALRQVESVTYGAAPISPTLLENLNRAMPSAEIQQFYGMSEAAGAVTRLSPENHRLDTEPVKLKAAGQALPGIELRIVGSDMQTLPKGEPGEIAMRGPHVMRGYWNAPELTSEAVVDGWLRSGDVGYMDQDGFVFILDRFKDMVITGGENVYCSEVENAVAKHPAVSACSVFGVPDDKWGESVHCVVVVKPGHTTNADDLNRHCRQLIAAYKSPRSYEIRHEDLPVSAVGKINKVALRREYVSTPHS